MTISVVIPVFNVEKYLKRCLDSVLAQTFKDFELILIDDGSTDGSPAICDEYAQIDQRIRVVHQKNCGSATTRNIGISLAKGDYLVFVDSDDWVEPDYLKLLYNKAQESNSDIVMYNSYFEEKEKTNIRFLDIGDDYCAACLTVLKSCSLWLKLFTRNLLVENDIRCIESVDLREDFVISFKSAFFAKKISQINDTMYHYNRINEDSLSSNYVTYSEAKINQMLANSTEIERFMNEYSLTEKYRKELCHYRTELKLRILTHSKKLKYSYVKLYSNEKMYKVESLPVKIKILFFIVFLRFYFLAYLLLMLKRPHIIEATKKN